VVSLVFVGWWIVTIAEQIDELGKKVTQVIINYSCKDGYSKEEAEKLSNEIDWCLHTKSYREAGLGYLYLMENSLCLILELDEEEE